MGDRGLEEEFAATDVLRPCPSHPLVTLTSQGLLGLSVPP